MAVLYHKLPGSHKVKGQLALISPEDTTALKWHEAVWGLLPTGCSKLQKEIFHFFTKKAFRKQMEKK